MTDPIWRLRALARERARRLPGGRVQRGQSVLEMAIFLPLILVFSLACIQFAVIFIAYINVLNVTRDAARWVSVHPHVIDTTTVTTVKGRLPSGITGANLTITFSPACTSLTNGQCPGRASGTQIAVTSTYVITPHLFLPATFGWGSWVVTLPTTLPSYTIYMQVEPN
jgi:hypothetical protein